MGSRKEALDLVNGHKETQLKYKLLKEVFRTNKDLKYEMSNKITNLRFKNYYHQFICFLIP